jgi:hypothetical protein
VTIPIRLILYISYKAPIVSSCQTSPRLLKTIVRGFLVLLYIGIWSLFTISHHLNLLPSLSPSCLYPPTLLILQSCFLLLIFKLIFKMVSQCGPTVGIFVLMENTNCQVLKMLRHTYIFFYLESCKIQNSAFMLSSKGFQEHCPCIGQYLSISTY